MALPAALRYASSAQVDLPIMRHGQPACSPFNTLPFREQLPPSASHPGCLAAVAFRPRFDNTFTVSRQCSPGQYIRQYSAAQGSTVQPKA